MFIEGYCITGTVLGAEGIQRAVRCSTSLRKVCNLFRTLKCTQKTIIQRDRAWVLNVCRWKKEQANLVQGIREDFLLQERQHFLAHEGSCIKFISLLWNWIAQATFTCGPNWGHIHLICFLLLVCALSTSSPIYYTYSTVSPCTWTPSPLNWHEESILIKG